MYLNGGYITTTMIRASIFVIGLILMAAMQGNIDDLVEAKKQRLLK